jgi:hypothetical protein
VSNILVVFVKDLTDFRLSYPKNLEHQLLSSHILWVVIREQLMSLSGKIFVNIILFAMKLLAFHQDSLRCDVLLQLMIQFID